MQNTLDRKISALSLFKFSLPTIVSMVFMGIYTTVDGVFVSRLVGTNALSAVNIVMPIITASIALGTMFGTGGSAVVALKMGQKKDNEAKQNFSLLVITSFVLSLVLAALGLLFISPILRFLGANDDIFVYCYEYALPTLILLPFSVFGMVFQVFFITAGKAGLGLTFSVMGGLSNIVLDYLLIAVFKLGISGAAIATGIGYSIPAFIGLFYFLFNRKGTLYLIKPKWDIKVLMKTCTNGASEMVTNLAMGVVTLLLNVTLMKMAGPDGVASITIILYAQLLLSSAYMGYAVGIAPIISYNYGKQDTKRLKKIYSISRRLILGASIFTFAASLIFAKPMVAIFSPAGTSVYEMAVHGYRLFAACFLFMGFNIYGSAMFTALSNGKVSAIISFLRTLVFVVAAVLLLPVILGIDGVWIAIPLAEFLGIMVTLHYFRKYKNIYHYA